MADNTTLNTGSGGDTIASDDISGVKYPRSKIVIGADGTNDGDVSAANPLPVKGTGSAGTANAGVVTVQGIASMTALQVADNSGSLTVDAPVGTPVFVRLSDGSSAITALPVTDNSGSLTVDNAGTFAVQNQAATSGGATPYYFLAAAGSNQDSTVVKASAGQVYSVCGFTVRTTPLYLKLYDKATGPTSSDTPVHVFQLPSQGTANGAGFTMALPAGLTFANGISFRITTGIAVSDSNAATAADCVINLGYK